MIKYDRKASTLIWICDHNQKFHVITDSVKPRHATITGFRIELDCNFNPNSLKSKMRCIRIILPIRLRRYHIDAFDSLKTDLKSVIFIENRLEKC